MKNDLGELKELAARAAAENLTATEQGEIYAELRALYGADPLLPVLRALHEEALKNAPDLMVQDAGGNWYYPNRRPTRPSRWVCFVRSIPHRAWCAASKFQTLLERVPKFERTR